MKTHTLFFLIGLLPFYAQSSNKQLIKITKVPEWVKKVDPQFESSFSKYDVNSGVYNSTVDYQTNLKEKIDFNHFSLKIVTDAGISMASEIAISYDTTYQQLEFHFLNIWRNGKKIIKTDQLSFELLNNEQELQNSIYSGQTTAHEILEDIRKGDYVEYAYSITGRNPIYEDYIYASFPLEDVNPIDLYSVRVIYPKDANYKYDCNGCQGLKINLEDFGSDNLLEIVQTDLPALEFEETSPTWYIPYKTLVLGNFKSWADVNDWAQRVFEVDKFSDTDLSGVFEEIFDGNESEEEKINAILEFVQNDIRYMGIENGIGSVKPFPPSKVVEQRFGDCKDKSLLLVTLLNKIGVQTCFPVLVSSSMQETIKKFPPGAQLFDHCITLLQYKGKDYWLDPTIPLQGGSFKTKRTPDYGPGLIVRNNSNKLISMKIEDDYSRTEISESITIKTFSDPATLTVVSNMYGSNADVVRAVLEYYSIKDISKELKTLYGVIYPNIEELQRLKVKDDIEKNVLTLTEKYSLSGLWTESKNLLNMPILKFQYEPVVLYSYINSMVCEKKNHPVQILYPNKVKMDATLELPSNISIASNDQNFNNKAFAFSKSTSIDNKTVKISYGYGAKTKEVLPNEFSGICNDFNSIVRDFPLEIYYGKTFVDRFKP